LAQLDQADARKPQPCFTSMSPFLSNVRNNYKAFFSPRRNPPKRSARHSHSTSTASPIPKGISTQDSITQSWMDCNRRLAQSFKSIKSGGASPADYAFVIACLPYGNGVTVQTSFRRLQFCAPASHAWDNASGCSRTGRKALEFRTGCRNDGSLLASQKIPVHR
jgi:hypothetical protein